jgi:hypothetical protein
MRRRDDESATPNHRIRRLPSPTPLPLPLPLPFYHVGDRDRRPLPPPTLLPPPRNGAEIPALSDPGGTSGSARAAIRPSLR